MTKHIPVITAIFLLFLTGCGNKKDIKEIRACFDAYKTSILNKSGNAAIRFVDRNTISYYSTMAEYAKTIKSKELQSLSMIDKMMVLTLRHRATSEELNAMDGNKLFIWAVNRGMIGAESVERLSLGDIAIKKDKARGRILSDGKAIPAGYNFTKEQGRWKIDLTSIMKQGETALQIARKESGKDEREFIFYLLEITTGKDVDPNIWYRLVDKPNIPDDTE